MIAGGSVEHLEHLERLVDWRLRTFRDHSEWEDIRQEGLIAAWMAVRAHPDLNFSTVICNAARWGALEYLRSRRCRQPVRSRDEVPAPTFVAWADYVESGPENDPRDEWLERLSREQILSRFWELLWPREREAVRLVYGAGLNHRQAGDRMGCDHRNVYRLIQQGMDRYRKAVGLPCRNASHNSHQRRRRLARDGGQ